MAPMSPGSGFAAVARHAALVMAAFQLRDHRCPAPQTHRQPSTASANPGQPPLAGTGMIPVLALAEIARLLSAQLTRGAPAAVQCTG